MFYLQLWWSFLTMVVMTWTCPKFVKTLFKQEKRRRTLPSWSPPDFYCDRSPDFWTPVGTLNAFEHRLGHSALKCLHYFARETLSQLCYLCIFVQYLGVILVYHTCILCWRNLGECIDVSWTTMYFGFDISLDMALHWILHWILRLILHWRLQWILHWILYCQTLNIFEARLCMYTVGKKNTV